MKRREAIHARQEQRRPRVLSEIDYLLGVHDLHRAGALRFKGEMDGPFLDDDERLATPPLASLRELEYAARQVEENGSVKNLSHFYFSVGGSGFHSGARLAT